jgi:hypothetical protein
MLDLESFSKRPEDAAIISIGAIYFDPRAGTLGDGLKVNVTPKSLVKLGIHAHPETISWWFEQKQDVRDAILDPKPIPLHEALAAFSRFYGESKAYVWGNGANYDNVALRAAYEKTGQTCPWLYKKDSCYRTLKNHFDPESKLYAYSREGAHDALNDAVRQARHAIAIFSHYGMYEKTDSI